MLFGVYSRKKSAEKIEARIPGGLAVIMQIQGRDRAQFAREIESMQQLRSSSFVKRLVWSMEDGESRESDEFDELDTLYVLSLKQRSVVGCLRVLPTTGATLLKTKYAELFETSVCISSPLIMEFSHFAVASGAPDGVTERYVCRTTVDLAISMCEILCEAGIQKCIALFDERLFRIYRRIGWAPEVVAHSRDLRASVGLWSVTREASERMRELHGIPSSRETRRRAPFGGVSF
jgi:acyl homoserine lactone synthase